MTINDPFHCLSAGLVIAFAGSVSPAATLTMTATPTARYDDDYYQLPFNGTFDPGIYQIDFAFEISGLAGDEMGFGAMAFDVGIDRVTDALGWQRDLTVVDNWPFPGGIFPIFAINQDAGPSATDLQRILVAIPSGIVDRRDPRRSVGQFGPLYFGSLFLKFDGVGTGVMSVENLSFVTTDLMGRLNTVEQFATGPSIMFGVIPEPTTLAILWTAAIAAVTSTRCGNAVRNGA